jgi:hypothetical protein
MVYLRQVPVPDVPWDDLLLAAADLRNKSAASAGYLDDAKTAWSGLTAHYGHPDTETRVATALDELAAPTREWATSLARAATAVEDFVGAGRAKADTLLALSDEAATFRSNHPRLFDGSTLDDEDRQAVLLNGDLDGRIQTAITAWGTARADAVAALGGISGGTGDDLPEPAGDAGSQLPAGGWATLTTALDGTFGGLSPSLIYQTVAGLNDAELLLWAQANPVAAQTLANNRPMGPFASGSPEQIMIAAMGGADPQTSADMRTIREAWLGLGEDARSRMLLLYPGVFGALNGIPMADRVTANKVNVVGEHQNVRDQADALSGREEPGWEWYYAFGGSEVYLRELEAWENDVEKPLANYERQLQGLEYAMENGSDLVFVSSEGDGRIVSMNGQFTPETDSVFTLVPGTGADLSQFGSYDGRLTGMQGDTEDKVSFYWQNADLPNEIPDNVTDEYSVGGGPELALFDMAVDLEAPTDARTTYAGYSAGASLLGEGEKEGLDSTNIVYLAPAGPGPDVHSVGDTQNEDANRYWIQTRDDPISWAQLLGETVHGGSPGQMDAIRLEAGFKDEDKPDSLLSGHTDYFDSGSTAMHNLRGVIDGTSVSLHVPDEMAWNGAGYSTWSPIELKPEDYAYGNLEQVDISTLE